MRLNEGVLSLFSISLLFARLKLFCFAREDDDDEEEDDGSTGRSFELTTYLSEAKNY